MSDKFDGLVGMSTDFLADCDDEEFRVYQHLCVLLYADDTIVLAESAGSLQTALDGVKE